VNFNHSLGFDSEVFHISMRDIDVVGLCVNLESEVILRDKTREELMTV
jgi:hypothetical protein